MIRGWLVATLVLVIAFSGQAQIMSSFDQNNAATDSINKMQLQTIDSIQAQVAESYIKLKNHYDSVEQKYNSIALRLQYQFDSLKGIDLPTNHRAHKLDSMSPLKEEKLSIIKSKLEEVKSSALEKIDQLNLPPELKTQVDEYTGAVDKLDLSLPASNLQIPSLSLTDKIDLSIPNLKSPLGEGLPNLPTANIPKVGEISQATTQLQELNQAIPKDITSPDQLAKAAENQMTQIKELNSVQGQLGNLPENPLISEEQAKQELLKQANGVAVDHFAGKEQELKSAMDQLSKYKKKFPNINNLEEITKRRPNEMKGKPLVERIVPGIAFQIQKKNDELLVDFNPYAGYRFTGKLTGGLGWNQRVSYNLNKNTFHKEARIYGPRTFAEYKLWKGLSPRAEVEVMNTFVPPYIRTTPVDLGSRQWVWGVFVGMKKDYKFLKKINGTALVMVRLFDPHRKSPYADIINARFGFEFPMKKKAKV